MKPKKISKRIANALANHTMVVIAARPQPEDTVRGFVVQSSDTWILVLATTEGGYYDGYTALRTKDIFSVKHDKSFQDRFARTQDYWPPKSPQEVDLSSVTTVLETLTGTNNLCGIESTYVVDAMWIGAPHHITKKYLYLHEVDTDAQWHKEPLGYRLKDITRVHIDGQYIRALSAVTDERPEVGNQ